MVESALLVTAVFALQCTTQSRPSSSTPIAASENESTAGDSSSDPAPDPVALDADAAYVQFCRRLGNYGIAVALTGDWDGDDRSEIAVAHPTRGWSPGEPGRVELFSGRTGRLLERIEGGEGTTSFGGDVVSIRDVDGDGAWDLLVPGSRADSDSANGFVAVVGSRTRRVIRELVTPSSDRNFGCGGLAVWSSGGAQSRDYVVGLAPSERTRTARLSALDLENGESAWSVDLPFTGWDSKQRGPMFAILADVDHDAVKDFAVCLNGKCMLVSGRSQTVLPWQAQGLVRDSYAYAACGAWDIDGDGCSEIIIGDARRFGALEQRGVVAAYSGADGRMLWSTHGRAGFGFDVRVCPGVDGDGYSDVVASVYGSTTSSIVLLRSKDGRQLRDATWTAADLPDIGWRVNAAGDVDGDGVPDMLGARFDPCAGVLPTQGAVVFSGATGALLFDLSFNAVFDEAGLPRRE